MSISLPLRIFAGDPATTLSGWCLLELVSINPLQIKILKRGTIDGPKLLKTRKDMMQIFQKQFCILDALEEEYTRLLDEFRPDLVASEGAFAYVHVSAALALTLAINVLRRCAHKVLNKDVAIVPPTITKMAFAGKGNADKDQMRKAYLEAPFLIPDTANEEISEHEIDAIGHGVGFIRRDIVGDVVQISAKEKKQKKKKE